MAGVMAVVISPTAVLAIPPGTVVNMRVYYYGSGSYFNAQGVVGSYNQLPVHATGSNTTIDTLTIYEGDYAAGNNINGNLIYGTTSNMNSNYPPPTGCSTTAQCHFD